MTIDSFEDFEAAAAATAVATAAVEHAAQVSGSPAGLQLHRRSFLKALGAGAILCFSVRFPHGEAFAASNVPADPPPTVKSYFAISADNTVTLHVGATELGQGIMSALAQLAAEELRVPWSSMKAVHGIAELIPAGRSSQSTGGSRSMMNWYTPMRVAAATAREMLLAPLQRRQMPTGIRTSIPAASSPPTAAA